MSPKNPAAVALGRKGGQATAKKRTPEERSSAARKAVEARWAKLEGTVQRIEAGAERLKKKLKEKKGSRPKS